MGTGLQCPTCGHLHPLAEIRDESVFRCGGCGRMLSVPSTLRGPNGASSAPPRSSSPAPEEPTRAQRPPWLEPDWSPPEGSAASPALPAAAPAASAAAPPPAPAPQGGAKTTERRIGGWKEGERPVGLRPEGPPPPYFRALIWLMALPIGFVVAAVPLRLLGVLHVDQLIDIFAGSGLGRFAILLLLLPLWAGVTATLAHLVIEALTRHPPERVPTRR